MSFHRSIVVLIILARGRQIGHRWRQTLKSGEPRSPDPGVSTGMIAWLKIILDGFWHRSRQISKLQPQHCDEHHIKTGDSCPAPSRMTVVWKKRMAVEWEFHTMERAGIISRSTGSPWDAPLQMVKKPGVDEWRPCGDFSNLNTRTIADSYIIPNLHSLNFQLKG